MRIAVPGTLTTAFLTLRLLLGREFTYEVLPFDQILGAVAEGRYDAGLIIPALGVCWHETVFH